jgi:D-psicose/D-tagatose/L-ribulose 3-epimerase
MANIELGMISSAWGGSHVGIEDGVRKAKEIGFDAYDVFEDPLDIDDATRELIKRTSEEVDLPIRGCVCVNFGLVDFNPSVTRFALDRTRAYLDQAAYFNARNLCVVIGEYYWDNEVFPQEAVWETAVKNVQQIGRDADDRGLDVVIELEPFSQALVKDVHELGRFIDDVGHPRVKANADISHLHLSHASFEDVAVLAGKVGHMHVSDCDGEVHGDLPPGRGKTPIKDYVGAVIERAGFTEGAMSLELEYSPDPAAIVDWVEEAYTATARILDELGARAGHGSRAAR